MGDNKPLVIVLSRNYSTGLGIIRSLGEAGYIVDLVASVKKSGSSVIASSSKYVRRSIEVKSEKIQGDTGETLIEALLNFAPETEERIVLFPTDDFTTMVVDDNRELLARRFDIPGIIGGGNGSCSYFMNKSVQHELASDAGLLVPMEWIVSLKSQIIVPKDVVYPCFVKPLASATGHKTEMKICENQEVLKTHLEKMKSFFSDREVLVQEYLEIDKEYDMSGVCLDKQVIIPGVIEKTQIAQYELGVTMAGKMIPVDTLGDTAEKIKTLLRKIGYVGIFDLELNLCKEKIYFNEINFRSGGPNYAYFLNGVNLPKLLLEYMNGKNISEIAQPEIMEFGKSFVYEKVAWEDFIHGYLTNMERNKIISDANFTLLNSEEDPKPGKIFEKKIKLSAIKQRIKKFIFG